MQENNLVQDLENQAPILQKFIKEIIALLAANGISTYSQLFDVLRDENAPDVLREQSCSAMYYLRKSIDRRRAVPALLTSLKSKNIEVRMTSIQALGMGSGESDGCGIN